MPEWETLRIGELLDGQWPGEWGADIDSCHKGVRVFRSTEIDNDGHLDERGGVYRYIPASKLNSKRLRPNDVLLEASGGTPGRPVGRVAYYSGENDAPEMCANFLRVLRPREGVSGAYLRWALHDLHGRPEVWRYQQQTTGMSNLNVRSYLRHELWFPDQVKQQQIAEILSTVDEAVEQTEALIAKTQQIKAGLMHDLFTRGVTPDGQLRPAREAAPQLYKESPLGWIPKEWSCEFLDKLADRGSGHTPNRNIPHYWNGGIKWVSLADSSRLDHLYIEDTEFEISELGIQNSSAVLHPQGVVVLSRDAGVGKSAITTKPMAVSQHFMCWRCDERLDKYYLYYWLQFKKRMFENIAVGTTIQTIGLPYFRKLRISSPTNNSEQQQIGEILQAADQQIFEYQSDLEKSRKLKAGLMSDLLSGRTEVS
mgnify:CR=1 FL=1|tara:strand:- start:1753 stop:3027 length:1275 start_codon:yes stop_codon:yes gene_type:complete